MSSCANSFLKKTLIASASLVMTFGLSFPSSALSLPNVSIHSPHHGADSSQILKVATSSSSDSVGISNGSVGGSSITQPHDHITSSQPKVSCSNPLYNKLCQELKGAFQEPEPEPEQPQWKVIYSGSGTTSLSGIGQYTQWKAKFSYDISSRGGSYPSTRTASYDGNYGQRQALTYSAMASSSSCGPSSGGGFGGSSTSSSASVSVTMSSSISTASLSNKGSSVYGGCGSTAQAYIGNVKITYLEVYQ